MSIIRRLFLHSPIHYVVAFVITAAVGLAVLFSRGFDKPEFWMDALTAGGAVAVFFGLLLLVARLGAFDTFSYSFKKVRGRVDKDLYEYSEASAEKRSKQEYTFMPYITVGAVVIVIGVLIRML